MVFVRPFITAADILAHVVYLMFNQVKDFMISPIHKKSSRVHVENYRPKLILPRISLIFKRISFASIQNWNIASVQHGFLASIQAINSLSAQFTVNFDENVEQFYFT